MKLTDNVLTIDGLEYNDKQIRLLIQCAVVMFAANAQADDKNGGDHHMDWEWIDPAFDFANRALPQSTKDVLIAEARINNDFDNESEG